ncbi:hypothetical protein [Microbacterium sp. Se63.02b]|uniref:hypothetical protein n=1 Tax=Microbacterium sp. Se63.02b TaxID=2709304 RepID=UPI001604DBF7|nr:hypothetical protein [Microbacterium sp. Se63.02b]QNA91229.1 hypothetical protein G4G29_14080 [Microbacterium sp. Se63.02b]
MVDFHHADDAVDTIIALNESLSAEFPEVAGVAEEVVEVGPSDELASMVAQRVFVYITTVDEIRRAFVEREKASVSAHHAASQKRTPAVRIVERRRGTGDFSLEGATDITQVDDVRRCGIAPRVVILKRRASSRHRRPLEPTRSSRPSHTLSAGMVPTCVVPVAANTFPENEIR